MKDHTFDAIVIGSGISGGWSAKELCEAGLRTLVLERGRNVTHLDDYPTALKDPWEFPHQGKKTGPGENQIVKKCYAFDESTEHFFVKDQEHPYVQEKPFDWIRGYQVGGKSLIWARQTQRWSHYEFESPKRDGYAVEWPISYQELAPYYSHVEKFVGISGNQDGIESLPDGEFLPPWELNCVEKHVQKKVKEELNDRHVIIGRCAHLTAPKEIHVKQGRAQCQARNLCYRGCPYGAYFSSNSSTLPWAAKTGKLTLRANSIVEEIIYDEQKQKATGVRIIDTITHEVHEYFAKIIFVNAGCLNTNLILLNSRSKRFPNGLGNDYGNMGHYISFHNYRGNAVGNMDGFEDSYYKGRRPTSAFMPSFRNLQKRDADFLGGYMIAFSAARGSWNRDVAKLSFGEDYKESMTRPGPWHIFMMMQGENIPIFENHVRLDPEKKDAWGIPQLVTSIGYTENDMKMQLDFQKQAREILEISGAKEINTWDTKQNPGLDIHEMGGVRMGLDPKTSLLNQNNQLHTCKNVFVTDGAAMTSVGNQNPSLTFMALTARATKFAVAEMKKLHLCWLGFLLMLPFHFWAQSAEKYDVIVYGSTSAGVISAYSAKMLGKKTLLIDAGEHIGGLTSGGLGFTDIGNKYAVSGIARDFYRKIGQHYGTFEKWTFEPKVTQELFKKYLQQANVKVSLSTEITRVLKRGNRILKIQVKTAKGLRWVEGKQFIDCTYEGDLMAMAGVSYTVGREDNGTYGETWNGFQRLDKHQFPDLVDPFKIKGDPSSGLLWGISKMDKDLSRGKGDAHLQAYNFRICLTDSVPNQIKIRRPKGYDSTKFELLLRYIEVKKPHELNWLLMHIQDMPNRKTDINNSGPFSTDMIGESDSYAEANWEKRKEIIKKHRLYNQSFLYFLGHDQRVPTHLREEMLRWGYPKDEYQNTDHWSPQIYVREARRMIGDYVMTQANCESKIFAPRPIGLAAYTMDSHNCQRLAVQVNGVWMTKNEGDVQVGGFPPYPIDYGALIPKKQECENLLVPVCLSATHIAYGSIRMEPVFMVLGESAAIAAVQAIDKNIAIQDVNVSEIQQILANNPLLDHSKPELLIDDLQAENVHFEGDWKLQKSAYGCYVTSLRIAGDDQGRAVFKTDQLTFGSYELFFYLPNLEKNSHVFEWEVKINGKNYLKNIQLDQNKSTIKGDWISLGKYSIPKKSMVEATLLSKHADGLVPADAILWVPRK